MARGHLAVAVHVGAATTAESVALAGHAASIGADAMTCVTPWYYRYDEETLAEHFAAVAATALARGAAGFVSGLARVIPEPYAPLWTAWEGGDHGAVQRWDRWIGDVTRLTADGARLDYFKHLLARRGVPVGHTRPPLAWASETEIDALAAKLQVRFAEAAITLGKGAR